MRERNGNHDCHVHEVIAAMAVWDIQFIAGRYHATPWDAHVNEGRIDWPPSPWRLARAMVAVGYAKQGWPQEPPPAAVSMIEKVASQTPAYSLPPAFETHTRHYMPIGSKPAKVIDAFLRFERRDASLLVHYDVEFDADETAWLGRLAESLGYLGRAKSWVDARLLGRAEADRALTTERWSIGDCTHLDSMPGRAVRCLAGVSPDTFAATREAWLKRALPIAEAKAAMKKRGAKPMTASAQKNLHAKVAETFPKRPFDSLRLDTRLWQGNGWPQPPGTRWSTYVIPEDAIRQPRPVAIRPRPDRPRLGMVSGRDPPGRRRCAGHDPPRVLKGHFSATRQRGGRRKRVGTGGATGTCGQGPTAIAGPAASWLPIRIGHADLVREISTSSGQEATRGTDPRRAGSARI